MARRQVSIFVNGKQVANEMKSIYAAKRQVNAQINLMTKGSKEYNEATAKLKKLNGIIADHKKNIGTVSSSWSKITAGAKSFIGVAGIAFTADALVGYGKELFHAGVEMDTLGRKAKIVFGEALPLVTEMARENAAAMGLTVSQYTDAATAIGDLLIPMGFQREEAANISGQLVNLSGALAEWTGGQKSATEVSDILKKALLGEREQLKELGISIQEADVKARLAEKGMTGLTGKMLQQAKAAVTLELVMEKSTDAQTAFAEGSDSLIRKQTQLSAKFSDIQEKIASALIPVFNRLLTAAIPVVEEIEGLVESLTSSAEPTSRMGQLLQFLGSIFNFLWNEIKGVVDVGYEFYNEVMAPLFGFIDRNVLPILQAMLGALGLNTNGFNKMAESGGYLKSILKLLITPFVLLMDVLEQVEPFIQDKVIPTFQQMAVGLANFKNLIGGAINSVADFFGLEVEPITMVDVDQLKNDFAEANRVRQESGIDKPVVITSAPADSGQPTTGGSAAAELPAAGPSDKALKKQEDKEAAALEKKLQRLQEITDQYSEDARVKALSEDEQKIAAIEKRYNEQIAKAKELEAAGIADATQQRLELERLRDDAINTLRTEQQAARLEKELAEEAEAQKVKDEVEAAAALAKKEAQAEIDEVVREELLTERQQQLAELGEQYTQMLELAEQNGIDTKDLNTAYQKRILKTKSDFDKKDYEDRILAQKKQAQALETSYTEAADTIGGVLETLSALGIKNAGLTKVLTLAQIGASSAAAIAKGTAAAAGVPFPGNLAAIASTVATVATNIAKAKTVLSETPVPQKKDGGFTEVVGKDDGITYRAKMIGAPDTGILDYNSPVLYPSASGGSVLANEVGREFLVSNSDLKKPAIFNHVRAIKNLSKGGTPQFRDGGFTGESSSPTPPTSSGSGANELGDLAEEIRRLNDHLDRGIPAIVGEDAVIDIFKKYRDLDEASGGVLADL